MGSYVDYHEIHYLKLSAISIQCITDGQDIKYQDLVVRTDSMHGSDSTEYTLEGEYDNISKEITSHEQTR